MALDRQGLLRAAPFGRGVEATARTIEALGYVQIDTISVVARAHHHVLATRVPNYRPRHLETLFARGRIFEYWAHAAAILPMRDYRFQLPVMQGFRDGTARWQRCRDQPLMQRVLDHVRAEGPVLARDFEHPDPPRSGWWDWKPAKRALEQLFMQGDLMVSGRQGFEKSYDLTERVLPPATDTRMPALIEQADYLVERTLASHAVASAKSFTHLLPGRALRDAVRDVLWQRIDAGTVTPVEVDGAGTWFAATEALDRRAPAAPPTVRVLSPFDNAVILRHRTQALFDFDYVLECYVPQPKRRFGYFCLPLLYRDVLVGRLDCKAHRRERRFEIKHAFIEKPERVDDGFPAAFAEGVARLAALDDCDEMQLARATAKHWLAPLRTELARRAP
jgi:uncharacterized protein YcaQ